jgi:hypothetical protein
MNFSMKKTIAHAAKMGLVLGVVSACGGSTPPADSPESTEAAAATEGDMPAEEGAMPAAEEGADAPTAEGKDCCKGMNECKGKGGCRAGEHSCKGQNECKGQGGCNSHCPS